MKQNVKVFHELLIHRLMNGHCMATNYQHNTTNTSLFALPPSKVMSGPGCSRAHRLKCLRGTRVNNPEQMHTMRRDVAHKSSVPK